MYVRLCVWICLEGVGCMSVHAFVCVCECECVRVCVREQSRRQGCTQTFEKRKPQAHQVKHQRLVRLFTEFTSPACMFVCLCVCVCMCVCVCVSVQLFVCACLYACMHACACVCGGPWPEQVGRNRLLGCGCAPASIIH